MDLEEALRLARTRTFELFPLLNRAEDPLLTLEEVAELHGVSYPTTLQWRQRSKPDYDGPGKLSKPFPDPVPTHRRGQREWRLSDVISWSLGQRKWPNPIGRPETRRPRDTGDLVDGRHRA